MSCKPDLAKTAEMWGFYRDGKTLKQVGDLFGVTRQSVYDRFHSRGLKLRSEMTRCGHAALPFIDFDGGRYAPTKDGYFRRTTGDRKLLHRAMYEKANGPIKRKHELRFLDGDRMNVVLDNIEMFKIGEGGSVGRPFPLKSCLYCQRPMGRRYSWNTRENPAAYRKRKTCDVKCASAWKRGRRRGVRMPRS
jgi:hypothetical protein